MPETVANKNYRTFENDVRQAQKRIRVRIVSMTMTSIFNVLMFIIFIQFDVLDLTGIVLSRLAGLFLICLVLVPALGLGLNYLEFGRLVVRQRDLPTLVRAREKLAESPGVEEREGVPPIDDHYVASPPAGLSPADQMLSHFVAANRGRIGREMLDLRRRGNLNLLLGILTTICGVVVLGYVVFAEQDASALDHWTYVGHFAMRLSIALFIEVFAYFFLRLYKSTLEDIRYYQNELTNSEAKWSAIAFAFAVDDKALLKGAVDGLSKTERNFTLKKGETTVSLERERLEKNEILDIVRAVVNTTGKQYSSK